MGVYENFETIKDALGYANLSTEEIIAKGHLSEASIAMIDKKMEEAHDLLCHFPIGYTYDEKEGDPENGIDPGTLQEDLPDDFVCPLCGVGADQFRPLAD